MKTILVFDCWLPGFTYVKDLAHYAEDVRVVFVHTSSLQTGAPAREYRDFKRKFDIPEWVHDFSDFTYDFDRLIESVKPDALLVLSLHHLEARTALLFAKQNGIPSYFIPHGIFLFRDDPSEGRRPPGPYAKIANAFSKLPRIWYYSSFFWRFHFALRREGQRPFALAVRCYLNLIRRYYVWQWKPTAETQQYYADAIDQLIVYDNTLKDYYDRFYGAIVGQSEFLLSGTLDMARLVRHFKEAGSTPPASTKEAYYISSPYPDYFTDANATIYAGLVGKLKKLVEDAGYDRLVYRPHPGEPADFTTKICSDAGVELDRSSDIGKLIAAQAVCGTSSSLLYAAVVLKKTIVILDTQQLKVDAPYYEPLISYPKVSFNADLDEDPHALADLQASFDRENAETDLSQLRDPISDLVGLVRTQPAT